MACIRIKVVADRDCPKGFFVDASQLNAAGAEIATDTGRAKGMVRAVSKCFTWLGK